MPTIDELRKIRKDKLAVLRKKGIDPYPASVVRKETILVARDKKGETVTITGRIMGIRGHGKIVFADLVDETGKIQVVCKDDVLDKASHALTELLDIGDFLEVQGNVDATKAGEISVFAASIHIICKAIRPLPNQWHGLKDIEDRYRQRYVDLMINPGVRDIFIIRTKVLQFLRNFLDSDGFLEVETPVLQPVYGGASAKPFTTHHNALDADLFLRISDELYLKRLIVSGFEKVYEVGKDFRNEGIDRQHNPEFTMLEFYWAYADYDRLMKYTEDMLSKLVKTIKGTTKIVYQGMEIDFTPPWKRVTYRDAVLKYSGIDINAADDEKKLMDEIKSKKIQVDTNGVI
jgi:lysyl-tRNA synthetase class 2